MTTSLKPIEYTVETIDYNEAFNAKPEAEMSFSERLAMQIQQADTRVTLNRVSQSFDWQSDIYTK